MIHFILLFCPAFCLLWILFQAAKKHYTVSRSASDIIQEGIDHFTEPQKQFVYYRKGFRGHNYPRWFFPVYFKK